MFQKYLPFLFHVFSIRLVLTSLTDPRCAEICASKNKMALSKKSIYANMLKSKDTTCLVTCYLTDKGIAGTKQESVINSSINNIVLTKNKGSQNMNNYTTNLNSQISTKPSLQQSQVNTGTVKISPTVDSKQVTLNTSLTTSNHATPNVSVINPYTSSMNSLPNSFKTSQLNSYNGLSNNTSLQNVNSAPNVSNQTKTYASFSNDNVGKILSEITKKGENNKTYLLTTGHVVPDTSNKKTHNSNTSLTELQINNQEMINEMIRNHHEKALKQINTPKQKINKETPQPGVKEASFVLNNKAKLYRDLNKLDSLIKMEETQPVSLYNEANKLKREEIEENTAKLIYEANRVPDSAHNSLSHTEDTMESESYSLSEDYDFLDSDNEEFRRRKQSPTGKHSHKERRHNNENEMTLNRKEKELKNEVLKNTNIKKQLAESDLIITEPTKSEYKKLNPERILVGITPLGDGHVITSGNTNETLANETEYGNLNINSQNKMKHDTSSIFGPQIEFLGGLQNNHNKNMNGESSETFMNISHPVLNINDTGQNIDNFSNFLESANHQKLIHLENQISELQNIHKQTVENIHNQEIVNHLNSIDRRTGEEAVFGHQQRIEEQLVNEDLQRKHEEEVNRRIEEERIEEERRIQETMEEERRIQETTEPFVPMDYPPIEDPLNETAELQPPVLQTEEEIIQTPTETVASQIETVETVPHEILEVPLIMPTPPINSNNMIYSGVRNKMTSSYNNRVYTTGLTDVII